MKLAAMLRALLPHCRHRRRTWPLSILEGRAVAPYSSCLDCGRELPYQAPKLVQTGVQKPSSKSAIVQRQTKGLG